MVSQYTQRVQQSRTGFQQTADVVGGCQSVINDNSECDQAGDSFNILTRWWDLSIISIRPRKHNKELIPKTRTLNNKDFIVRMLYKDMY